MKIPTHRNILVFVLALLFSATCAASSNPESLDFSQWVVKVANKPIQTIDFSTHPTGEMLESRVQSERGQPVNFGGRYHLFFVGCGTMCQSLIAVDVYSGKIIDSVTASAGACFFPNSALLVVNPDIHEMYEELPGWASIRYVRITPKGFIDVYQSTDPYVGECNH